MQEYEQIIAWFESEQNGASTTVTLEAILDTISRDHVDEDVAGPASGTIVLTDYKCMLHTDFTNSSLVAKLSQRDMQPENADRLSVLIDNDQGLLVKS